MQSGIAGPVEKINVKLDDEVNEGDTLYLVDNINSKKFFELAKKEFETRKRKVEILRNLVKSGSDSEFRLLDEELSLVEAEKRYNQAKRNLEFSSVKAPISGSISSAKVTNIGQLVKTGDLLSEIVPKDDMLKIEASVLPKDIAYVRKGQKAKIAFGSIEFSKCLRNLIFHRGLRSEKHFQSCFLFPSAQFYVHLTSVQQHHSVILWK